MKRPCSCHRVTSSVWSPDQCRLCWLAVHDPRYAKLFATLPAGITSVKAVRRDDCEHLGRVLERSGCNCPGKWVRACDLHERCRTGASGDPVRSCLGCADYVKEDT